MSKIIFFKRKLHQSEGFILAGLITLLTMQGCSALSLVSTPTSLPTATPTQTTTLTMTPIHLPAPTATITPTPSLTPVTTLAPRWVQYEDALSKVLLGIAYPPESAGIGLCEWAILGHSDQEVYVWAECQVASTALGTAGSCPAVIRLLPDGKIGNVVIPRDGADYGPDIRKLFPLDVQERINHLASYFDPPAAMEHIDLRRADRTIPPMIVAAGTPLP